MTLTGLVPTIHWLEELFGRIGLSRFYGGAIAYNYYGPPRLTQDVDVLVLVPDFKKPHLVSSLAKGGCKYGDPPTTPPTLEAVLADLRGKAHLATFWRDGIRIEVFVPWHPFHSRVLERSPERDLGGRRVRIHSAEDLIVFKKVFDRPKDIMDIKAILLAQKGRLDTARILEDAKALLIEGSWRELRDLVTEYG